jgi:hypothetical protein
MPAQAGEVVGHIKRMALDSVFLVGVDRCRGTDVAVLGRGARRVGRGGVAIAHGRPAREVVRALAAAKPKERHNPEVVG